MYDIISQAFLALFVIAYLALLAALAWWALGGQLGAALKSQHSPRFSSSAKDGPFLTGAVARKGTQVRDGHRKQLQRIFFGPQREGLVTDHLWPVRFLLNSNHEEFWRHGSVESNGDTGSSLRLGREVMATVVPSDQGPRS